MRIPLTGVCRVDTGPVRHDHPLESPLFAEEVVEQPLAFRTVNTVDAVVTRHVALGLGLGFGDSERLEVDFSQGSIGDITVVAESLEFLFVADKVLHGGRDTLGLKTVDVRGSDLSAQVRVFREGFKASTAER